MSILDDFFLSKSSCETFTQCGLKFNLKYLQKVKGEQTLEDKEASVFGNLIHELKEEKFGVNQNADVLKLYHEKFVKYPILSQKFYDLGARLIEDYVRDSAPGKNVKILGVEIPFQFYLDNGVPIKGIIDRVDQLSEDEIEIIDYKTGFGQPLSPDELASDIQIGMYNLAANYLFPKFKKVKLTLNYLHFGRVSVYRDQDNLENLKGYLSIIYEKIQNTAKDSVGLEPRINSYCGYCEYKNKCTAYKEVITKEDKDIDSYNAMILPETGLNVDIEKIDVFHEFVKAKLKILKKLEEQVKEYIAAQIKEAGENGKLTLGKTNYSLASKKYVNYKVEDVIELAKEKGLSLDEVLSVQKGNLEELIAGSDIVKLKKNASTAYGKAYVK